MRPLLSPSIISLYLPTYLSTWQPGKIVAHPPVLSTTSRLTIPLKPPTPLRDLDFLTPNSICLITGAINHASSPVKDRSDRSQDGTSFEWWSTTPARVSDEAE